MFPLVTSHRDRVEWTKRLLQKVRALPTRVRIYHMENLPTFSMRVNLTEYREWFIESECYLWTNPVHLAILSLKHLALLVTDFIYLLSVCLFLFLSISLYTSSSWSYAFLGCMYTIVTYVCVDWECCVSAGTHATLNKV